MKLLFLTILFFYDLNLFAGFVVDHNSVEQFENIPAEWILAAKDNIKLYYQHTSHGSQIIKGADRIKTNIFRIAYAEESLPDISDALNIYEDTHPRECNFWADTDTNIPGLEKHPEINVALWSWCCELNSSGTSINRYFSGMQANELAYSNVIFIYMTGNAQSWHGHHTYKSDSEGYTRYLKNEEIRRFCRENNKILFDFADIDCWHNGEKAFSDYEGNIFQREHDQYNLDQAGHTSYENCERKAKAFWYMMARLAGWEGENGDPDPEPDPPPEPEPGNSILSVYMADPETRISQKIYCQIQNVESTDKLQAILDDQIIYDKSGNLLSEEIFEIDYHNQRAGNHNLIIRILDFNNIEKASFVRTWKTLHNGIPIVGIDKNNSIRVNDELFFPVYPQLDTGYFQNWIENGYVNAGAKITYLSGHNKHEDYTLQDYHNWLNFCVSLGVGNIGPATRWAGIGRNASNVPNGKGNNLEIMTEFVRKLKDHSGVLMWQWSDEPDGGGTTNRVEPDEIRTWTDLCHQYDTNHPHAVNLTAYYWARDGSHYVNHCKDYSFLYNAGWFDGQKKVIADVIGFDFYPIEYATKSWNPPPSFESMAKALDRIRDWNYNLVPVFSWIESCDIHPDRDGDGYADGPGGDYLWTAAPTPDEMWAELWIKIIHGVKGIKGHPYNDSACKANPPYNYQIMNKFMSWINDLKNVVLGPDYNGEKITDLEQGGGRIDIMVKKYAEKIYLFAANVKYESETVRFMIPGLQVNSIIRVYDENRIIASQVGYFQDNFSPIAVHCYEIDLNPDQNEAPAKPKNLRLVKIGYF